MTKYRVTLTHEVEAASSVEALNRFLSNDPAPDSVQVEIGWKNCSDNGGQYVRGTLWMTCVG